MTDLMTTYFSLLATPLINDYLNHWSLEALGVWISPTSRIPFPYNETVKKNELDQIYSSCGPTYC